MVGASLTAADKEAFQAFDGGARKANAAKAVIGKTKAEAAKTKAAKAAHHLPVRTVGQAPAATQQLARPPAATASAPPPAAPAVTAAPPEPQPAPAREAVGQASPAAPPAPGTTAAPAQTAPAPQSTPGAVPSTPHPAVADQRRTAEPRRRHQRQVAHARPTEDTESDADDDNSAANPADRPRQETDSRARSRHRRYVRVRPADQERMRLPDDGSDRVTVVTKRRPPAYGPPFEQPYDRAPEVRRGRGYGPFGLFGGWLGAR
jgi:hypothetical protein